MIRNFKSFPQETFASDILCRRPLLALVALYCRLGCFWTWLPRLFINTASYHTFLHGTNVMLVQREGAGSLHRPNAPSVELESLRDLCHQLRISNEELREVASAYHERLEEETHSRRMLEACVDQHKEALIEEGKELDLKEQTIKTQTFLLKFAWEDAQNLAALQA